MPGRNSSQNIRLLGDLAVIAGVAVSLRFVVFFVAVAAGHLTLAGYTAKGDTTSYLAMASSMSGERSFRSLEEYDRRVFPGYPALIAIAHLTRIPLPVCALCVTWLSAGVAAAAAAKAFGDVRVGWAMTCLIPHYLINSSLGMSEAPLLAAICVAFLLWRSDRIVLAGIAFGLAGLIRPMACFALVGVLFSLGRNRRGSWAVTMSIAAALPFAAGFAAMQYWTGDALQGVHVYAHHPGAYAGHMIVWPFSSLVRGTAHASLWRNIYIWVHVLVTLLAIILVTRKALTISQPDERDSTSFPWLACNTAMVLCLGPPWGFAHFPRFSIPAEPAMFWTLRGALPRKPWVWCGIAVICSIFAVIGVIDSP